EERLGARDGGALDDVHVFAAAVVAAARIAFGVLVGEHRAGRFENRAADEVLGGDQLEAAVLAMELVLDRPSDLRIDLCQRAPNRNRLCRHTNLGGPERPALNRSILPRAMAVRPN